MMLMDLSFFLSFSPTGSVRKEGSALGEEWLLMARRWRKRRKMPLEVESVEVTNSRWQRALAALLCAAIDGGRTGECTRVVIGDGHSGLVAQNRRFESVLRSAI